MKPIATILEEVRALDEKATIGPWEVDNWETTVQTDLGRDFVICVVTTANRVNDAPFIAASRTLLPRLAKALEVAISALDERQMFATLDRIERILNGEGEDA